MSWEVGVGDTVRMHKQELCCTEDLCWSLVQASILGILLVVCVLREHQLEGGAEPPQFEMQASACPADADSTTCFVKVQICAYM